MARHSIGPRKLLERMIDPAWLAKRGITLGGYSVNTITIYHDDGCPCGDEGGLMACTCRVVDYEILRVFPGRAR